MVMKNTSVVLRATVEWSPSRATTRRRHNIISANNNNDDNSLCPSERAAKGSHSWRRRCCCRGEVVRGARDSCGLWSRWQPSETPPPGSSRSRRSCKGMLTTIHNRIRDRSHSTGRSPLANHIFNFQPTGTCALKAAPQATPSTNVWLVARRWPCGKMSSVGNTAHVHTCSNSAVVARHPTC